jgi:Na+/melibiose symporter-like transporter
MKGFLQKMAYTIQTIILFSGLEISKYDETLHAANSAPVKNTISFMMLGAPIVLFIVSFVIFTFKFKLHGKYMEEITAKIKEIQAQSESDAK